MPYWNSAICLEITSKYLYGQVRILQFARFMLIQMQKGLQPSSKRRQQNGAVGAVRRNGHQLKGNLN